MNVSPTINNVHGRIISITGTDPEPAEEISETVPPRRRWKLLALSLTFVTGIAGADRKIRLIIDDGTNVLFQFSISQIQIASKTYYYSFADMSVDETFADPYLFHPFPALKLHAGYRIRTNTLLLKAADNFAAPQLLVEEWIDP